jgi:hypothetical protein
VTWMVLPQRLGCNTVVVSRALYRPTRAEIRKPSMQALDLEKPARLARHLQLNTEFVLHFAIQSTRGLDERVCV